ncbi:ANAPC4 [Cordylochernes scorpioides]|uniref:Anaphase-promoting complex subunit 4 n=1 Tax=Cordylochernes scorpioides TaxID=51811 RepID=A0ABY6L5E0_9ARAC|nr:ANAPC4 [Cordylochernes scorpioides]
MLFRLSWQRVWHRPGGPTALAWRPDGRVLAIGLAEGKICLVEVEAAETIHKMEVDGEVTSLIWTSKCESVGGDQPTTDFYKDMSGHFLPKLPALDKTYTFVQRDDDEDMEGIEDMKRLRSQTRLNMLVAGTDTGWVHFFAFGIFPSGSLDLVKSPGESCRIISAVLSEDLGLLTVVSEHSASSSGPFQYHLSSFDVPLLQHKHRELMVLAKKYGQITSLLSYLASTIKAISEAWEDILLEIDCKLTNYAQEKAKSPSTGTVSDDFLELLMFGTLTDPLERFLLNDLTEKGLKKIGHSIDLSYSNIQKLVLKHLQSVTQCLFYHMGDIRGMAGWEARFGELGLSPTATHDAIVAIASFLMKSIEVQQVIDDSMKNFKAFFRWLYTVIMRLADEQVPVEIIKVNQQDLDFVADFLKDSFSPPSGAMRTLPPSTWREWAST